MYSVALSKLINRQLFQQLAKSSLVKSNLTIINNKSFSIATFKLNNLKFTDKHEWIHLNGNIGTVGITDYAQVSIVN